MIEGVSIGFILVCALLGVFGQLLRSIIGIVKCYKTKPEGTTVMTSFKRKRFVISLAMGGLIGAIFCLIYSDPLSKTDGLGILAASYAGTDWLEGLLAKKTPK